MTTKTYLIIAIVTMVGLGGYYTTSIQNSSTRSNVSPDNENLAMVAVSLPETLSANAQQGKTAFNLKCAVCHGENGVGQNGVAPPLIHKIYEPSHHGDESFQRAVKNGVRSHHWKFGDMAPVIGLTRADVNSVVTYIRELQRFNGIN